MTRVALFIPTYRPGIDVTVASIKRQTVKPDALLIGDELHRDSLWHKEFRDYDITVGSNFTRQGNIRGLCRAYNDAAKIAKKEDCNLFISLQDYIYVPEDGIEKFVKLHEEYPEHLLTGITHISKDPLPSRVVDRDGLYTIFAEPYEDKPKLIEWSDPRERELYAGDTIVPVHPEHWEANWAAVPVSVFTGDNPTFWDESYDNGIAYENMDFAQRYFRKTGNMVLLDKTNQSISLPHKRYWPQEEIDIERFSNRQKYEQEWNA